MSEDLEREHPEAAPEPVTGRPTASAAGAPPAQDPTGPTAPGATTGPAAGRSVSTGPDGPADLDRGGDPPADPPEPPADPPASVELGATDSAGSDPAGSGSAGSESRSTAAAPDAPRRRRLSAAGAVIGLLLGLLGFAFVVQLRSNSTDQQLATDRPEDLVRILSDLDARKDRLSQEISGQQTLKQQLTAGSQSRQAALAEASQRADELGILAGTLAAQGPGLRVEFRADTKPIQASDMLDAVEELRGAGAEAMQIAGSDGSAVRIVASTAFLDGADGALLVDGRSLSGPYTVTVIGEPQTMQIALKIPSGVVDTVQHNGGTVSVVAPGTVQVSALHQNTPPRYAQPAG